MLSRIWTGVVAVAALLLLAVFIDRWGPLYVIGFIVLAIAFRARSGPRPPQPPHPPSQPQAPTARA